MDNDDTLAVPPFLAHRLGLHQDEPKPVPLNPDIEVHRLIDLHDVYSAAYSFQPRDVIRHKPGIGVMYPMVGAGFAVVLETFERTPLDPNRPHLAVVDMRIACFDEDGDMAIGTVDSRYFELVTPELVAELMKK